jgi:SAM-dependent methyltransferase
MLVPPLGHVLESARLGVQPRAPAPSLAMSSTERPEWKQYLASHHGHVGLPAAHPLRAIELEANFLGHLPPPSARVLEIGFGQGATLRALAARGYTDLHGWDISSDCVELARASRLAATIEHADALLALDRTAADSFDAILAKDLLEHLPREQVIAFVRGIHRALRPGGVFLARLPNMANPLAGYLRYDDFTHTLGFTENSVRQVFVLGGFDRAHVDVLPDRLPGLALLRRGLLDTFLAEKVVGPLVRWLLARAIHSQRKGPPRVSTLRLIVVARKAASVPA